MEANVPAHATWKTITLHSLPVLGGAVLIGVLSGQILVHFQDRLFDIPVLLALIPAVNGIGGNVGSVLGSRVASGLHLGGLWSNNARGFKRDILASLVLAAATFAFLGAFARLAAPFLGIRITLGLGEIVLVTLLAGLGLMLVMVVLVILVGMLSHRYGWDPDNVVVPVLTTAGDTLGIVFLLLSAGAIGL